MHLQLSAFETLLASPDFPGHYTETRLPDTGEPPHALHGQRNSIWDGHKKKDTINWPHPTQTMKRYSDFFVDVKNVRDTNLRISSKNITGALSQSTAIHSAHDKGTTEKILAKNGMYKMPM